MILEVPREMRRVSIFVHKTFLDKKLSPVQEISFGKQLEALNQVRYMISMVESRFPSDLSEDVTMEGLKSIGGLDFRSETYWSLAKSRLRSSPSQTWSDYLDVVIPP